MKPKAKPKAKPAATSGADYPKGDADVPYGVSVPTATNSTFLRSEQADYFHPFGGDYPRDFFMYYNVREHQQLDALICGCGDLRDVAHTLDAANSKFGSARLGILLVDLQAEVIARNLLLLHAIVSEPDKDDYTEFIEFVGQLWWSLQLEPAAREYWDGRMHECLTRDWLDADSPIRVRDEATLKAVRHCWRSWLAVDWSTQSLSRKRDAFAKTASRPDASGKNKNKNFGNLQARDYIKRQQLEYGDLLGPTDLGVTACQVERLASDGIYCIEADKRRPRCERNLRRKRDADAESRDADFRRPVVNPTMLVLREDGTPVYSLFGTLPFDAACINYARSTVERGMLDALEGWVYTLQETLQPEDDYDDEDYDDEDYDDDDDSVRNDRPKAGFATTLTFALSHAVNLMEELAADPKQRFDVIHTYNLLDTCGILNLVLHGSVLMKPPTPTSRSLLFAHTRHAYTLAKTRTEYLERVTGLPLATFPTLFGVQLADQPSTWHWSTWVQPFAWNKAQVTRYGDSCFEEFAFLKLEAPTVPVSLSESDFLRNSIVACAEALCTISYLKVRTAAASFSTGALIAKILAYAIASGRLVWSGSTPHTSLPWPNMGLLWHGIRHARSMHTSMTEIFTQAQLHGFPVDVDDMGRDTYLYRVEAVFPVDYGKAPTPHLVLKVEDTNCNLQFESLSVTLIRNRSHVQVMAYLPRFVVEQATKNFRLGLYREFEGAAVGGRESALLGGVSKGKSLFEVTLTKVRVGSLRGAIDGILQSRPTFFGKAASLTLPVLHAIEAEEDIQLVLTLPAGKEDAKLGLETEKELPLSNGAATLKVNGKPQTMRLACPAHIKKVLAARKQGRVTLLLSRVLSVAAPKLGIAPLFPQCLHLMPRQSDVPRDDEDEDDGDEEDLDDDFVDDEADEEKRQVFERMAIRLLANAGKGAFRTVPASELTKDSPGDIAQHLIKLVHGIFDAWEDGYRIIELHDHARGAFGFMVLHSIYIHLPQSPARGPTPMLDVTYLCLSPMRRLQDHEKIKYTYMLSNASRSYVDSTGNANPDPKQITMPDAHVAPFFEFLELCHKATAEKSQDIAQLSFTNDYFLEIQNEIRRAVLTPLFPVAGHEGLRDITAPAPASSASADHDGATKRAVGSNGVHTEALADSGAAAAAQDSLRELMDDGLDVEGLSQEELLELVSKGLPK
ncbi:translational activator for mitochondrial COX1 [Blastocladiella emersonii ATCC 22665]|nr:translational activator for mitochondrial COX1 [Blastocladiella emersonii ATCC 22665]